MTGGTRLPPLLSPSARLSFSITCVFERSIYTDVFGAGLVLARYFVQPTENKLHARAKGLNVVGRKRNHQTLLTAPSPAVQFGSMRAQLAKLVFAAIERKQALCSSAAAFPHPGVLAPHVEQGCQQTKAVNYFSNY